MTDLTVRKVWGDNIDHSGETITYKIQRKNITQKGGLAGPYDYIANLEKQQPRYIR